MIRNENTATWRGTFADFNGDGIVDYAGTRHSPEAVEIWQGKGDGRFEKLRTVSWPAGYIPHILAPGDLNNDGIIDLVVSQITAGNAGPLAILLGKGEGSFQAVRQRSALSGHGHPDTDSKVIDIDGDGRTDLLVWLLPLSGNGTSKVVLDRNLGATADPNLGAQLRIIGAGSAVSTLEHSSDLANWSALVTNSAPEWSVVHGNANAKESFYRVRSQSAPLHENGTTPRPGD